MLVHWKLLAPNRALVQSVNITAPRYLFSRQHLRRITNCLMQLFASMVDWKDLIINQQRSLVLENLFLTVFIELSNTASKMDNSLVYLAPGSTPMGITPLKGVCGLTPRPQDHTIIQHCIWQELAIPIMHVMTFRWAVAYMSDFWVTNGSPWFKYPIRF